MAKRKTKEEFIAEAKQIHGDKYDYSKVEYINTMTKVCIICPTHGEFLQEPLSHLHGCGCPNCSNVAKRNKNDTLAQLKIIHNNKYFYHDDFLGIHKKIKITCPIHGDFEQLLKNHLKGQGCPECSKIKNRVTSKYKFNNFIEESKKRFGDVFEFPNIENEYENSHSKITFKCKTCGETFIKIGCDHLTSHYGGCPKCHSKTSKFEKDITIFLKNILPNEQIIENDRDVLDGMEIDILIPNYKIGFECNGLFWHSEKMGKDKYYHLNKTNIAKSKGITLYHIFEDEYIFRKDILFNKIKHILHCDNSTKIMARKCEIKNIDYATSKNFLEKYHIQGNTFSTIKLGCFYQNELIGVMIFLKENETDWILTRFATNYNYICQGIGGKLFDFFKKNYKFTTIKSFADKRWTTNENNLYIKLGFNYDGELLPDYRYLINNDLIRHHKFGFRKKTLEKKYNLNPKLTEKEMCEIINASRIWDCGLIKYIYYGQNN